MFAEQARSYAILGYPGKARDLTWQALDTYASADHDQGLDHTQLSSITGAVHLAAGELQTAAATLTDLLHQSANITSRTMAVDLTRLATIYLRIGETSRGIVTGHRSNTPYFRVEVANRVMTSTIRRETSGVH